MIQRRQTLYLISIVILGIVLFFLPVMQFTTPEYSEYQRIFLLSATGLEEEMMEFDYAADFAPVILNGSWGMTVISLLIPVLALIDIFLYNHRLVQARLNIFTAVVCVGYYGILMMYTWFVKHLIHVEWSICFAACLPLVCLILVVGATRLILRDEMMVRAADRIR